MDTRSEIRALSAALGMDDINNIVKVYAYGDEISPEAAATNVLRSLLIVRAKMQDDFPRLMRALVVIEATLVATLEAQRDVIRAGDRRPKDAYNRDGWREEWL